MTRSDLRVRLVSAAIIAAIAVLAAAASNSAPVASACADLASTFDVADVDDGATDAPVHVHAALVASVDIAAPIATDCPPTAMIAGGARRPRAPLSLAPKTSPPALRS